MVFLIMSGGETLVGVDSAVAVRNPIIYMVMSPYFIRICQP